jgi:Effector-associated domain 7
MGFTSAEVRDFMHDALDDEELTTLCFDYFREAYDDFSAGMSKGEKIQRLIEYCQRRNLVPGLFLALQQARPQQFKERFGELPPPHELASIFSAQEEAAEGVSLPVIEAAADQRITTLQYSINDFRRWFTLLVSLGLCVALAPLLPFRWEPLGALRQMIFVAGISICALSGLQFKEIVSRREVISNCQTLKNLLRTARAQGPPNAETRALINNLFTELF